MSRPTLGVVAISYNEEKDLPRFLEHLLPWVDEIVIVDDGSTDSTKRIASSAGSKVQFVEKPREDGEYFSHQRNKGIEAAKSDWLLHMDIDERVTKDLADEVIAAITRDDMDGFRFRRLNYYLHRPFPLGGWQHWNLVHLARRPLLHFAGKSHETCVLNAPAERVGQLRQLMHHLNDESFSERLRKNVGYAEEAAETILESGKKIRFYHIILYPLYRFLKAYFFERAFLGGVQGLIFSLQTCSGTFNWYAVAWDRQNLIPREELESSIDIHSHRHPPTHAESNRRG